MTPTLPPPLTGSSPSLPEARLELLLCQQNPIRFLDHYGWIYDPTGEWVRFRLWPSQRSTLRTLIHYRLLVWLKARQLGMTWLALGWALHTLLFRPGSTVLLFSRRDDEATDLLERLKGMSRRLPPWAQMTGDRGNTHEWALPNGSRCLAFPTTAGDSYSATLAIVDEADLVPDLDKLLGSVKPTIDAGGQLLLLSRPDKDKPLSPFKRLFRSSWESPGVTPWHPVFLPWNSRPDRDAAWYEAQKQDSLARTGSLDSLWEQYPSSPAEALSARTMSKRFPLPWLQACSQIHRPLPPDELIRLKAPLVPGLRVYAPPDAGCRYVIGGDPAEGNPQSDDSALAVMDAKSYQQVATLAGKVEPEQFARMVGQVSEWYNHASAMIERNNHGHSVLLALRNGTHRVRCLRSTIDGKDGWLTTSKSKAEMYDKVGDCLRERSLLIVDDQTQMQLADLEGATLKAPESLHDDAAVAIGLCVVGAPMATRSFKLESFGTRP